MCTAISYISGDHYFGRNLDLEHSFGESVIVTPRAYRFDFRCGTVISKHYAIIGIGIVEDGYPLYYDAVNESGLCAAGLNFNGYARYGVGSGKDSVAVFELIPWLLCQCESTEQARRLLERINLTDEPFNTKYPVTPLHFIISDKHSSITLESTEAGIRIYDNPVGVLTNNPDFPYHMTHLADFVSLSAEQKENTLAPHASLPPYSRGMGGMGLPGDMSSASRFVRAVFLSSHTVCEGSEGEKVSGFLRMLDCLSQVDGCVLLPNGKRERTVYSSCINADRGIYYYKTYNNPRVSAVTLGDGNRSGKVISAYPLLWKNDIKYLV